MFHKIKDVSALSGMKLAVQFVNGTTKIYDVGPLLNRFETFKALENPELFEAVEVDAVSYGKIIPGVDARKYGKQWVITRESMEREYGEPPLR
jgi:hypothetical protein